jgi:hypothetical protein
MLRSMAETYSWTDVTFSAMIAKKDPLVPLFGKTPWTVLIR